MSIQIDDDLRDFFATGVATVIGTHDGALAPEITRGWGITVVDGRTVEVCLGLPSSAKTLANLSHNGQIAMTCVRPSDYRQVQLKGRATGTSAPTAEDRRRVESHQREFMREVEPVGIPPHLCPRFWDQDDPEAMVTVRFVVEEGYDQTPGPKAGRRL